MRLVSPTGSDYAPGTLSLPHFHDVLDALHPEVGELADVAHAVLTGQDFDEAAGFPNGCDRRAAGIAGLSGLWFGRGMSLETLKREAAALDDDARRELCAFLISLREKQWAARTREMAAVLDDPDPSRWLTLDEFKERLKKIPEPSGERNGGC